MTRIQRSDYEVEAVCRCPPSHSNSHGPKGCTHTVIVFRCLISDCHRRGYPNDHSQCLVEMPCRCQVIGIVPTVECVVLENEKE